MGIFEMGIGEIVDHTILNLKVERSDWEVVFSSGATFGFDEYKAKEGGLRVRKGGTGAQNEERLFFTGLGYSEAVNQGAGISLSVTGSAASAPVNVRKTLIYRMPWGGKSLSFNELRGTFVMFEVSGNVAPVGASCWIMFISGALSNTVSTAGNLIPGGVGMQSAFLIRTSNACIVSGGLSGVSSLSINASAGGYFGAIF